jgi:hypothetical protein
MLCFSTPVTKFETVSSQDDKNLKRKKNRQVLVAILLLVLWGLLFLAIHFKIIKS